METEQETPQERRRPLLPLQRDGQPYSRLVRFGVGAWAVVGAVVAAYLLLRLVLPLKSLVAPVLLAGVIVLLLNPLVGLLERRGVPRLAGTALCYLTLIAIVVGLGSLVMPSIVRQAQSFASDAPGYLDQAQRTVESTAKRFGVDLNLGGSQKPGDLLKRNQSRLLGTLTGLGTAAASVVHGIAVFVVALIVGFYALVQLPRLRLVAVNLLPPGRRLELSALGARIQGAVSGYLRGQLLVATYVGVATSFAMWAIGLAHPLLVGVIAGVTNLIPLIGPFVGGAVAVVIALATGHPLQALWAIVAVVIVQQIDNHLITPNVMARTVELNPIAVILGLLLLGTLWGFFGALIAVPFLAVLKLVFEYFWVRTVPYGHDLVSDRAD